MRFNRLQADLGLSERMISENLIFRGSKFDRPGHAMGHTHDLDRVPGLEGNGLPMDLVGRAAVELEVPGQHLDVSACGGDRLAGVHRLDPRQALGVPQHDLCQSHEQAATLCRAGASPVAVEGRARRAHGRVDRVGVPRCDPPQWLPCRRALHVDACAGVTAGPAAKDEVFSLGGLAIQRVGSFQCLHVQHAPAVDELVSVVIISAISN
jgi:hypothetical protein